MLSPESAGLYDLEKNKSAVKEGLKQFFPLETEDKILSIKDVEFSSPDLDPKDWRDIYKAITNKKSISTSIKPTFVLKDKSGKVISEKKLKIGEVPLLTNLDTFIVRGTQYNLPTQFRLKPGGYARRTNKGTPEVFINAKGKHSFRLFIDEDKKLLKLKIGQGSVPLLPILKAVGASDNDIKHILGPQLAAINDDVNHDTTISKAYKALFRKKLDTIDEGKNAIKEYFTEAELDADVNKITLGKPYKNISKEMLLDATGQLISLTRGDIEPVNRESLLFKSVHSVDDMLKDKLAKPIDAGLSKYKMKKKMLDNDDIGNIVDKTNFKKSIDQIFTTSKLSRYAPQANPIAILNTPFLTTLLGEGGVHNPDAVPAEAKLLQNSHMGFLDLIHTPESMSAGISLNLAFNTKKVGNELKTKVINVKTGKTEWKSLSELIGNPLAFPGEFTKDGNKWKPKRKRVHVILDDTHQNVISPSVKYMISAPQDMFDLAGNTIPFLQTNQGNRGMTSAKMSEQAVPLVNPERPLVETMVNGKPLLDTIGDRFSIKATAQGIVSAITDDNIIIKGSYGKIDHPLFRNLPLNDKTILDAKVLVSIGDRVKKGDLLADSNFTNSGKYSYGVNLNTAYMPYRGYNHEDATLITESAAEKLKSIHMQKVSIPISETSVSDLKKYRSYFPFGLNVKDAKKFDDDGIIRIGETLHPNDIVGAILKKNVLTGADSIISKLKKSAVAPMKDDSTFWKKSMPGIVTDKIKFKDRIDIFVKTEEPFKVGDKLCVDELTEFLTKDGWKFLLDISLRDEFCTLNPKTHRIEYQNPEQINIYDHDGNMFSYNDDIIDQVVTLEHHLYIRRLFECKYNLVVPEAIVGKQVYFLTGLSGLEMGQWECEHSTEYITTENIIHYKGKVGCPTTPNGIVYIRRNGKTSWTGNSGRHGNKHIVSKIIPDEFAPVTEHGEKIDIMIDPHGVPTRINPGQILENIAGKVADLRGKPFLVENFSGKDYRKLISEELSSLNKQFNIKVKDNKHPDKVTIHDPITGKNIDNISVGKAYITKLKHQVENKMSLRGINEAYTQDNQPIQGGGIGGQSIDKLTMNALLGYNARNLVKEMFSVKNNRNAGYWRAVIHKEIPPAPKPSFELKKFDGLLKTMGINTVSKGTSLKLSPFTDAQILEMSAGEIPNPVKMFKGKGVALTPDKDGLFGDIAGKFVGTKFNHIKVDEPFISPPYKDAVKTLLNVTNNELEDLINK